MLTDLLIIAALIVLLFFSGTSNIESEKQARATARPQDIKAELLSIEHQRQLTIERNAAMIEKLKKERK